MLYVDAVRSHASRIDQDADLARCDALQLDAGDAGYAFQRPLQIALERVVLISEVLVGRDTHDDDRLVRFLEGAGSRGALELVADEVLDLLREGTPAEQIGLVCPSLDRLRAPLETALSGAGVPYAIEGRARLGQTPFGHALLSALRFLWQGESRRDLFGFLRSPYSGLPRASADYLEGRLRGNGIRTRTLDSHASRLRRKLEAAGAPGVVVNDWGVGYRLLP